MWRAPSLGGSRESLAGHHTEPDRPVCDTSSQPGHMGERGGGWGVVAAVRLLSGCREGHQGADASGQGRIGDFDIWDEK